MHKILFRYTMFLLFWEQNIFSMMKQEDCISLHTEEDEEESIDVGIFLLKAMKSNDLSFNPNNINYINQQENIEYSDFFSQKYISHNNLLNITIAKNKYENDLIQYLWEEISLSSDLDLGILQLQEESNAFVFKIKQDSEEMSDNTILESNLMTMQFNIIDIIYRNKKDVKRAWNTICEDNTQTEMLQNLKKYDKKLYNNIKNIITD